MTLDMTLQEWIEKYEKKTMEKYELNHPFRLAFFPKHGFAQIYLGTTALFVWQLCGNARWWFNYLQILAKRNRRSALVAFVRRPIIAFFCTFGFRITKAEIFDVNKRYYGIDNTGRELIATRCGYDGDIEIYSVKCEVK